LLGIDAYFDRPGYTEFRIGDYQHELGIIDRWYAPQATPTRRAARSPTGTLTTSRRRSSVCSRSARGSTSRSRRGGGGFVTASVTDPFGNVLGVMYNPHYVDVLGQA
jgi:hypothetical protein